jgi:hypothetical protein
MWYLLASLSITDTITLQQILKKTNSIIGGVEESRIKSQELRKKPF